jgi:hypothetical protein
LLRRLSVAEIPLTKGLVAKVDDADYERLSRHKWTASRESRGTKVYAIRWAKRHERVGSKRHKIRMHHEVLYLTPALLDGHVIDHRNHDSLDNRRENLEVVTQTENMRRSVGWKKKIEEPWL